MVTMATKTPDYRPGARVGKRGELTIFYHLKPSRESRIRKEIGDSLFANPARSNMDNP